eukprot:8081251-Lingulodinium_polyedra.AAC.1
MRITVADLSKVLAPVARMHDCGNRVAFDEEATSVMHKKSGRKTQIQKSERRLRRGRVGKGRRRI